MGVRFLLAAYMFACAYLSVRCSDKGESLEDLDESHFHLQEGKPHPHAATRSQPKGHPALLRTTGLGVCTEPVQCQQFITTQCTILAGICGHR